MACSPCSTPGPETPCAQPNCLQQRACDALVPPGGLRGRGVGDSTGRTALLAPAVLAWSTAARSRASPIPRPRAWGATHIEMISAWPCMPSVTLTMPTAAPSWSATSFTGTSSSRCRHRCSLSPSPLHACSVEPNASGDSARAARRSSLHSDQSCAVTARTGITLPNRSTWQPHRRACVHSRREEVLRARTVCVPPAGDVAAAPGSFSSSGVRRPPMDSL